VVRLAVTASAHNDSTAGRKIGPSANPCAVYTATADETTSTTTIEKRRQKTSDSAATATQISATASAGWAPPVAVAGPVITTQNTHRGRTTARSSQRP